MIMTALYPIYVNLHSRIVNDQGSYLKVNEVILIWFLVTTSIYFGMHLMVVGFVLFVLSISINKDIDKSIQVFILLYLISPLYEYNISFVPGVNSIFRLTYLLFISVFFLLPILVKLKNKKGFVKFGKTKIDKLFIVLSILYLYDFYRGYSSIPGLARESVIYYFEFLLPYFVLSRYLSNLSKFDVFLLPILYAGLYIALICMFEFVLSWRLYGFTDQLLKSSDVFTSFKFRGGYLRSTATFTQAIITGYFLVTVLAVLMYYNNVRKINKIVFLMLAFLILGALYTTSSRGPWVASVLLMFLYYVVFSENKFKGVVVGSAMLILGLILLMITGQFERFYGLLPFIGDPSADDYRSRLFDAAMIVFKDNILLGAHRFQFTLHPVMQEMRQGEGIIDIVNTYLNLLLTYGVVGLFSYLLIFLIGLRSLIKLRRSTASKNEKYLFSIFLSLLLTHLFVVATVSSIGHLLTFTSMLMGIACAFQISQRISYEQK